MGVAGILEEVSEKEHVARNPLDRLDQQVIQRQPSMPLIGTTLLRLRRERRNCLC